MRSVIAAVVVVSFAVLSMPAARADSCYSNSQCPSGQICWGGECRTDLGQTPSSSGGNGQPNMFGMALAVVAVVGLVMLLVWFAQNGMFSQPAALQRVLPPQERSKAPAGPPMLGWTVRF